MSTIVRNTIFFIGWMLSPLTFWNDIFVNIPISYLAACLLVKFIHADFALLLLISYWLSNIVGLYMMYVSGRLIFSSREERLKKLLSLLATIIVYSVILILLHRIGILKPV